MTRCQTFDLLYFGTRVLLGDEGDEALECARHHRQGCPVCREEMRQLAALPPNPDLSVEEIEMGVSV